MTLEGSQAFRITRGNGRPSTREKGGSPEDARQEVLPMLNNNMFPKRVYMSAEEWATVAPNPRQRDTEKHAKRADHLKSPHPIHSFVNMAVLPDGRRYKLDGHTRGYLWEKGEVEAPSILTVETWNCVNLDQVKELYGLFDNTDAVETASDRMFGAYREHGFEFQSSLLTGKKILTAVSYANRIMFGRATTLASNEYDLLRYWKPELYLLDACGPVGRAFPTGVTSASILTFRRFGPTASDFWTRYAKDQGVKTGEERDPVQALSERVTLLRGSKKLTGEGNILSIIAIALSAFHADRKGYVYSGGIKQFGKDTISDFAAAAKATIRTWE
jgi:hypothetical protein